MSMLHFWFDLASTYSYPAAMVIEDRARARGVEVAWRPMLLGPIFAAQGLNDSPFNANPIKGAYMWRDLERLTKRLNLAFQKPSRFPRSNVLVHRLILAAGPAAPVLTRALYHANFAADRDITNAQVLTAILGELELDADALMTAAQSDAVKSALRANGEEAQALGLFGAPSFSVGSEIFWGQDRLDMALDHAVALR